MRIGVTEMLTSLWSRMAFGVFVNEEASFKEYALTDTYKLIHVGPPAHLDWVFY